MSYLIILLLLILFIIIWIGFSIYKKVNKTNKELLSELIEAKKSPIIIWSITKYNESELKLLLSNPEVIDLLLKIFEYRIATKTDTIRSLEDTDRKVWYLDCLHETYLYFYQLKQKNTKKEQKIWQDLI